MQNQQEWAVDGQQGSAAAKPQKFKDTLTCQVEGCNGDLSDLREYHQRYKICEYHLKVDSILRNGVSQRFCQQCGRFHVIEAFDEHKRSCRERLQKHNARRRRKVQQANEAAAAAASGEHDELAHGQLAMVRGGVSPEESDPSSSAIPGGKRAATGDSFSKRKKKEHDAVSIDAAEGNSYNPALLNSGGALLDYETSSAYDSQESLGQYFSRGLLLNSLNGGGLSGSASPGGACKGFDGMTSNPIQRTISRNLVGRSASQGSLATRKTAGHSPRHSLQRTSSLPKDAAQELWTALREQQQQQQQQAGGSPRSSLDLTSDMNTHGGPGMGFGMMSNGKPRRPSRLFDSSPLSLDAHPTTRLSVQCPSTSTGGVQHPNHLDFAYGNNNGMGGLSSPSALQTGHEADSLLLAAANAFGSSWANMALTGAQPTAMAPAPNQEFVTLADIQLKSRASPNGIAAGLPDPLEAIWEDVEGSAASLPVIGGGRGNSGVGSGMLIGAAGPPQPPDLLEQALLEHRQRQVNMLLSMQPQPGEQVQMPMLPNVLHAPSADLDALLPDVAEFLDMELQIQQQQELQQRQQFQQQQWPMAAASGLALGGNMPVGQQMSAGAGAMQGVTRDSQSLGMMHAAPGLGVFGLDGTLDHLMR